MGRIRQGLDSPRYAFSAARLRRPGAVWDAVNNREIVLLTNLLAFGATTIGWEWLEIGIPLLCVGRKNQLRGYYSNVCHNHGVIAANANAGYIGNAQQMLHFPGGATIDPTGNVTGGNAQFDSAATRASP